VNNITLHLNKLEKEQIKPKFEGNNKEQRGNKLRAGCLIWWTKLISL